MPAPRCGGGSASAAGPRTSGFPTRPHGAGTRAACPWSGASPCFPASSDGRGVWTDSHCHIGYEGLGAEAVAEAHEAGVTRLVTIGTDAEKSRAALGVARADDGVWA